MYFATADGMRPAPLKHNPFNALVGPRPIGWVSTVDKHGVANLAPFSYFNALSSDPPFVMYAPNSALAGHHKDSYRNVLEIPEFVVSIVGAAQAEAMNASSAALAPDVDEFLHCGIEAAASTLVRPPRVAASKAALECRVFQTIELPTGHAERTSYVVIGEVVGIHIDESVIVDGVVDEKRVDPLARLGALNYATLGDIFAMPRPG